MIRIFICPKCFNIRMVSRKPGALCLHCGTQLEKSDIDYTEYVKMTEQERDMYRENYKRRMTAYYEKISTLLQKEQTVQEQIVQEQIVK
jgi:hypothetical protein